MTAGAGRARQNRASQPTRTLGTVRVRYQAPRGTQVTEVQEEIPWANVRASFEKASASWRTERRGTSRAPRQASTASRSPAGVEEGWPARARSAESRSRRDPGLEGPGGRPQAIVTHRE